MCPGICVNGGEGGLCLPADSVVGRLWNAAPYADRRKDPPRRAEANRREQETEPNSRRTSAGRVFQLLGHLLVTLARLASPGGVRSVVAGLRRCCAFTRL